MIGGSKQCTYLHDMVYKWPHVGARVGLLFRVSMEGFEHANKTMGSILKNQASKGGRDRADGTARVGEMEQALHARRSGTTAAQKAGRVNHTLRMRAYAQPSADLEVSVYSARG